MRPESASLTIDEVPLEWCFNPGVKLDFRGFADGYVVECRRTSSRNSTASTIACSRSTSSSSTRVRARPTASPGYVDTGCGMGAAATLYLLERGVRLTGTDAWSWDAPFSHTARRYAETHDASLIWEGHKAGREVGYCHLEKLHNLEASRLLGLRSPASR